MARRGRKRGLKLEAERWRLVVPLLTACLRGTAADDAPGWPSAHFAENVNDLAGHARGILYSEFRWVDADRAPTGVYGAGLDWDLAGSRGPRSGSMRSRRPRIWPCWQPPKPPPATTSSLPLLNRRTDLYPKR